MPTTGFWDRRALLAGLSASMLAGAATARAAPRKSIAVMGFDGNASFQGGDAVQGLTAMLSDALIRDGRFLVVERAAIADVSAERALVAGAAASSAPLTAASVLLRGTITAFNPSAGSGGLSIGGLGGAGSLGGGVGLKTERAEVEINLRLVDPATARILYTTNVKGSASARGVSLSVYNRKGMSFGGDAFKATPLGKACEQAIVAAIGEVAAGMAGVRWSAQVVAVEPGLVFINAGRVNGLAQGDLLSVCRAERILTDPATGAVIDVIEREVTRIRITQLRDVSAGCAIEAGQPPERGDIVRADLAS